MAAVVGLIVANVVAIAAAWLIAGRDPTPPAPTTTLPDLSSRHVSILGGLAGFAVTGMVLLVTLGRNLPDASGTAFTTLLAMFFVAYIGFFATSLLFANVGDPDPAAGFDVPGMMFAGAAITQFFTIGIGWFALRPLFEAFGLTRLAEMVGWLLIVSTAASYALLATQLHRSGYASGRLISVIPVLAVATTVAYGAIAAWAGLRSPDSALDLVVVAFVLGSPAFAILTALPVLADWSRTAPLLAAHGRSFVLCYAQGATVFVGFLVLAVLGLA